MTLNQNITHQPDYFAVKEMLLDLLDSPIIDVQHIGATARGERGILDLLVIVPSLHAMTTLDEKRLNLAHFYRLHHPYVKKCVFVKFTDMKSLQEEVRLHIVEEGSDKSMYYQLVQQRLNENIALAEAFNDFKQSIKDKPQQEYEELKSSWLKRNIAK